MRLKINNTEMIQGVYVKLGADETFRRRIYKFLEVPKGTVAYHVVHYRHDPEDAKSKANGYVDENIRLMVYQHLMVGKSSSTDGLLDMLDGPSTFPNNNNHQPTLHQQQQQHLQSTIVAVPNNNNHQPTLHQQQQQHLQSTIVAAHPSHHPVHHPPSHQQQQQQQPQHHHSHSHHQQAAQIQVDQPPQLQSLAQQSSYSPATMSILDFSPKYSVANLGVMGGETMILVLSQNVPEIVAIKIRFGNSYTVHEIVGEFLAYNVIRCPVPPLTVGE
jgi:hypothetical protein